jgi:hypothetical protein
MKLYIDAVCPDCDPLVVVQAFAGVASSRFRSTPLAQKIGMEFARAVVSDPEERSGFLSDLLRSARIASPGCLIEGRIEGAMAIGSIGVIAANLRAECDQAPGRMRAVYFTGFDGQCFYRVHVNWPGWNPLPVGTQDQVISLIDEIRFGP